MVPQKRPVLGHKFESIGFTAIALIVVVISFILYLAIPRWKAKETIKTIYFWGISNIGKLNLTTTGSPVTPFTDTSAATIASGPLRINPNNSRYFMDSSGRAILLTGSHTWSNLVDNGGGYPPPAFDYGGYLDFLQANNHNFFRLWAWEQTRWTAETSDNSYWFNPWAYVRSQTCCAMDGQAKFDLTQLNQAYFDRMRQRVIAAGNRGIYVSIMLFDGWSVDPKDPSVGGGQNNPWKGHPYNPSNNINGIDGDTNNDDKGTEIHTLSGSYITSKITPLQEAYVRKVIDTVNDLDNVLYEVCNECGLDSKDWQSHMVNYIHTYEQSKPKQHPVGINDVGDANLFSSPADWVSPSGSSYLDNPPIDNHGKVVMSDTDHICGVCGDRAWVWKTFMRGHNPIFMDPYDGAGYGVGGAGFVFNDPRWVSARANMGYILTYANRINLPAMTPRQDLCSTGYCLANPIATGAEYLVYLPSGGSVNVNLTGTQGTLSVEWFNPATGATSLGGTVSGGATRTLTAPFSGDAVLYLKSTNVGTPTSTPTTAGSPTPTRTPTRTLTPVSSASPTKTSTSIPFQTATRTPTNPAASATPTPTSSPTPSRTITAAPTATAVTGPVALYNFNSKSGTTLTDSSGYNNHGTLLNGPNWTRKGKYGSALVFDGVDDKVVVPDSNSLDLTNRLTLEAWVYPTTAMSGWDTILMKEQPPGNLLYALYANGDNNLPYGYIYINGEQGLSGAGTLPLNTWSHLALAYDGATLRFYVNGQLVGSKAQTGSIPVTSGPLGIGGNNIWANEYFSGRIDEVRIYNRALSQPEIQNDMNTPIN